MSKGRILVVDDNPGIRWALATTLRENDGFDVIEAKDGLEALDRLAELPRPDLVITDLDMPRMGGAELARVAHGELGLDMPFVIFSASGPVGAERIGGPMLGQGLPIFAKPDHSTELLAFVRDRMAARYQAAKGG